MFNVKVQNFEAKTPGYSCNDNKRNSKSFIHPDGILVVDDTPINDLRSFTLDAPTIGKAFDEHDVISAERANF